ncbi:Flap endonuclease GEN-like 1 [Mizuhopecten yessoensis]|uniref:Flap endonuclease GEN homolog 1 n=1 Tax=Mizuhopecten yessoensis TaxID=6573 RepID=A0A210R6E7_MIZYE|nr:Flap endonuclease GEN-like 1 [Mizuhopecten yessoensis]
MGVLNLWQILGPVQQHQELSELKGQVLAVDLSIWVCETQCVKQMQGIVSKPFLRNLFFRILHLLQLGVHLVFVVEGEAPDLKKDIMCKRQEARFHSKPQGFKGQGPRGSGGKGSRRNFNACLRECCRMLDCLGVPYLHSYGEAEALCAALDAAGLVDGCLTNDGDAFLYGARTVYRNFTMNTKDPHVESYSMSSIESRLGLDRQKMVAIALLLGCDYLPKGVPGVGVDKATKLLTTLQGYSILDRFHKWRQMSDGECVDPIESLVRKKALALPDFPQIPVITEFLTSKDKCPSAIKSWSRPQIAELQKFALDKMEWVVEYTLEKVLPLVTLWDMTFICKQGHSSDRLLQPLRVVKSRTRQGVHCYEVEWNKPESDTLSPQAVYTTIETQDLFSKCYPELVQEFEKLVAAKVTKGKSRKKKDVEHDSAVVKSSQNLDEDLCEAVGNLSLTTDTRGSQPSRGGSSSLGRKVEKERIQQENVKLLTQQLRDTEKEIRYSTHDDVKLNEQESHTASMVKGTASQQEGKLKVTPEVTVDRYNNSKIKLPDFTSDLSLHTRRNTEEHNRKAITVDMCEKKVQGTEKQNRVPDINRRSEVSTAVMISKQDTGVTEEECSDDEEEQAYIPLSQRVQINLKVALKKKHKASTKAKNFSIRSENLDVSGLCTMLGSVKGSQQLPTKLAITSTQPDQDTEGMCDKVEAHLPNPVTSTSRGVSKEQDKDKMMSDKSCTLGTAQKSYPDKTLLNVEGVEREEC